MAQLLQHNINLIAYHLPLDASEQWGNNHLALRRLGCQQLQSFASSRSVDLGWYGDLSEPISPQALQQQCAELFAHSAIHCPGGPSSIRRIGMVSGGGQHFLNEAFACGCDAFISGESAEQNWHDAQELGIHFYACGHFATENIAVHDLGAHLARQFNLQHIPILGDNPL